MLNDWFWLLIGSIGAFVFMPCAIWNIVVATADECRAQYFHEYTLRCLQNAGAERIQRIEATLGHPIDEVIAAARSEESQGGHHAVVDLFRSLKLRARQQSNSAQEEVHHGV